MSDKTYSKNEIDLMHKNIEDRLTNIEKLIRDEVIRKLDFTNGKVKKIIIALAVMFGIFIGLGILEAKTLLALIL